MASVIGEITVRGKTLEISVKINLYDVVKEAAQ